MAEMVEFKDKAIMNMINLKNKSEFRAIDITKFLCALLVITIHLKIFGNSDDSFIRGGELFF